MNTRYVARPVIVNAYPILSVSGVQMDGSMQILLTNLNTVLASAKMLARMKPIAGDYWVCQQDGYEYLNPKDVFESKYVALPA